MASAQAKTPNRPLFAVAIALLASGVAATSALAGPFSFGAMDPSSPIAAEARAAQRNPGPYPKFSLVPPVPSDVRPVSAWRAAVYDVWGLKRQTEANAAAISFALVVGEAEPWASVERAKIPPEEMIPPAADTSEQTEAFAAAARARATPPPPPN